VLVIGAGIAGLVAARDLQADGAEVVVVDKARGVGGRLATRRLGDEGATADHGAQFFTARSAEFAAEAAAWLADGVAEPWFTGVLGREGIVADDGELRYRGVPAMTGIAKHLAAGLDVRLQARVAFLETLGAGWRASFEDPEVAPIEADAVVITAPVPQALDLLLRVPLDRVDLLSLDAIEYHPCIALMVATTVPDALTLAPLGARRPSGEPVAWVADNQVKGVSPAPSITVHAGPETSDELWRQPDDEVRRVLGAAVGLDPAAVVASSVQRWRYAQAVRAHPEPALVLRGLPPAVVAGDAFGEGGRVEGAARSGMAAARLLAERLPLP
jgi:predicted NAD/FAD-dependent oxidoreductase